MILESHRRIVSCVIPRAGAALGCWLAAASCSPAALSIGVEDDAAGETASETEPETDEGSDTGGGTEDDTDPCWELTEPPCELIDTDLACVEIYAHELVWDGDSGWCVEPSVFLGCISALTDCEEDLSYWCDGENVYETAWACQPPGVEACEAPEPITGPCP